MMKSYCGIASFVRVAVLVPALGLCGGVRAEKEPEIRGGWSPAIPYQYEEVYDPGILTLRGLDIEVMQEAARRAGYKPVFEQVSWGENLQAIRGGELDFALGATPREDRREWAWFSVPYRTESIMLFLRHGERETWQGATPIARIRGILSGGGKLAAVRGFYYGPEAASLLASEELRGNILETGSNAESLAALLTGTVDGFLADRLAGASVAWKAGALGRIDAIPGVIYETDVSIMFSKASGRPGDVEAFDAALEEMKQTGELDRLARYYLVPQLLLITLETRVFRAFEIIGTVAFALSGVIIARRERYDVVGALVLAALPALGGGIIRDLVSGRSPLGIIQAPHLLLLVIGTVAVGFVFFLVRDIVRGQSVGSGEVPPPGEFRWGSTQGLLEFSDALGLSAFTVIGVMVAIEQRCEPLWLWGPVMAGLTGAGGGVLRDILRGQADIPTLKGTIYPEIALVWGLAYSLVIIFSGAQLDPKEMLMLTLVVLGAIVVTRLLVVQFGMHSVFMGMSNPPRRRDADS